MVNSRNSENSAAVAGAGTNTEHQAVCEPRAPKWKLLPLCTMTCYIVQVLCGFGFGQMNALWNPTIPLSALLFAVVLLLCIEPLRKQVDTPAIAVGFGSAAATLIFLVMIWIIKWCVNGPVDRRSVGFLIVQVLCCGIVWGAVRERCVPTQEMTS